MIKVDVDRMIRETEGVDSIYDLADLLTEKGVAITARTLFRWKKGGSIGKPKLMATAEALGMELRDILILPGVADEGVAAEWARCSEISDEDIDLLPDRIADDEQKASLKERKDELSHNLLEYLMENHFTDAFRGIVQDMLDPVDSNGRSSHVRQED